MLFFVDFKIFHLLTINTTTATTTDDDDDKNTI